MAEPGALAALLERAGLRVVDDGEESGPFVFPNAEISWRVHASAGPIRIAIANSGEEAVRAAFAEADRTRIEGSERPSTERLLRYSARPPFALERLEVEAGRR